MNELSPKSIAIIFFTAIIAAAGGNYGSSYFRSDPFTGTQGRELTRRIEVLEEEYRNMDTKYPPKWLIDWVNRIDVKAESCRVLLEEHRSRIK